LYADDDVVYSGSRLAEEVTEGTEKTHKSIQPNVQHLLRAEEAMISIQSARLSTGD